MPKPAHLNLSLDDLPLAALAYSNTSGKIIEVNAAAEKMLGKSLPGQSLMDVFPSLSLAEEFGKVSAVPVGLNCPVIVHSRLLPKQSVSVLFLEQAGAAELPKTTLSRISLLAENIPDAIIFSLSVDWNKTVTVDYVSSGVATIFGLSPEAVADKHMLFWDLIVEEDRYEIKQKIADASRSFLPINLDFRVDADLEGYRWFNVRAFARHNRNGKLTWDGVLQEVTVTKNLEQRLRDSEARLHNIFQSMINGIVVVNKHGEITYANPSAAAILLLQHESAKKLYFSAREWRQVDDAGRPYPTEKLPLAIALTEGIEVRNCEHGIMVDGEEVKWLSVNAAPLFNGDNEITGAVASFLDITKSRLGRIQLEELANDQKAILNASTDATFFLDSQCRVRVVNRTAAKAIEKVFGKIVTPGHDLREFTLPQILEDFHENFDRALRGQVITHQRALKYGNVLDVWALVRYLPVYDNEGNIIGVSFNLTDLTARKQAEDESLQKEMQLRLASTLAHIGDWEFDPASSVFTWSDEVCRIFEVPPRSRPSLEAMLDFCPAEYHPVIRSSIKRCLENGTPYDVNLEITTQQGKHKYIRAVGMIDRNEGDGAHLFGLFQDVTRERQTQKELEKLALIARYTDNAVVITDADRNIEWVNEAFTQLTEYTFEEAKGKSPGLLLQGDLTDEQVVSQIRQALQNGESTKFEIINYTKSGKPYWVEVSIQPIHDNKRQLINFIAIELEITARKEAELLLRQANEEIKRTNDQLSTLAENIPGGAIYQLLIRRDGTRQFLFFSSGLEQTSGISSDEILRDHSVLYSLHHPNDIQSLITAEEVAVQSLQIFNVEFRIFDKHNNVRWFFAKSKPKPVAEGVLFDGFVLDITDRKLAEQKIIESEARFRLLADSLPALIWMGSLDGNGDLMFTDINKQWRDLALVPAPVSHDLLKMIHPDDREQYTALLKQSFATREAYRTEVRAMTVDGHVRYLLDTGVPRFLASGEFVGFVGAGIDITDRKLAEQQLRESENRYRTIVEDQVEMICRYTRTGALTFANRAYGLALGYKPDELIGRSIFDFVPPVDHNRVAAYLDDLFEGRVQPKHVEQQVMDASGGAQWYEWFDVPVANSDGEVREIQSIGHNISYRKKLELEREERERKLEAIIDEKDVLLKEIHHRIKNNLQLISSIIYIKMLSFTEGEVKEFLEDTRQKIRSIALIHERLLQSNSITTVEISDYLNKLILDIRMSQSGQHERIAIETDLCEASLKLDTAIYCGLIVNELMMNAIKHAFTNRSCGLVWVRFSRVEGGYQLQVGDNGISLPASMDPERANTFGLQLLHVFTRQLGAQLALDRTNGTVFTITFNA